MPVGTVNTVASASFFKVTSDVEPCAKCNADPDEQPNSRPNEIAKVFDAFERAEHDQIARSDEEENNSE